MYCGKASDGINIVGGVDRYVLIGNSFRTRYHTQSGLARYGC
jgi:hypothetical protein